MMKYHGFTLVELMVTLAIAAILLTSGVPSFANLIKDNRLSTKTNELVTSLSLARSEAIKQGRTVNIKRNASWAQGWKIWVDTDGDNNLDPGEEIRVNDGFNNTGVTLTSSGGSQLSYDPQGAAGVTGTFDICDNRTGETGRRLTIFATGQISLNRNYGGCS